MNLYIDVGNTQIKISYKDQVFYFDSIKKYKSGELFALFPKKLKDAKITNVIGSSVVERHTKGLTTLFKKEYGIKAQWLLKDFNATIKVKADNPEEVGSDLVALATHAASMCDEAIIVNMGTATTITHVKNNVLKGTIICAGVRAQHNILVNSADLIDETPLKYVNKKVGTNTKDAVAIGIVDGHAEMIRGLVKRIGGGDIPVILSGGDAHLVKNDLMKFDYIKEATLEGLKLIKSA